MKELLLLRHAKSSWKDPSLSDFDRPLNRRGRRDAPRVGALLDARGAVPDWIVASAARRTVETAEAVARSCRYTGSVRATESLYAAPARAYYEVAWEVPDDVDRLLLVGHSPGLPAFLAELTGESVDCPTAALACVTLDVPSWSRLDPAAPADLRWYWSPKLEFDEGDADDALHHR